MNKHGRVHHPSIPRRHLQGASPTRTRCGASIAWVNIPTDPSLADCPACLSKAGAQ